MRSPAGAARYGRHEPPDLAAQMVASGAMSQVDMSARSGSSSAGDIASRAVDLGALAESQQRRSGWCCVRRSTGVMERRRRCWSQRGPVQRARCRVRDRGRAPLVLRQDRDPVPRRVGAVRGRGQGDEARALNGPALRHDAAVDPRYTIGFPPGASMSIGFRQLHKRLGGREILRGPRRGDGADHLHHRAVVRAFIDGRADGPLPVW